MRNWFYGFFMAWGMFLGIPCPVKVWDEKARHHMLACLPFVGCIVGGLWALAAFLLDLISCPKPIEALVLFVLPWLMTGFIHVDGYMDVCDAILSRRGLETRRRILKDPHSGAFAVICVVLLSIALFALFLSNESGAELLPLGLIPVSTRACAAIAVSLLRPMSTSQYSGLAEKRRLWAIVFPALALAASIAVPIVLYGLSGLAPAAAAIGYCAFAFLGFKDLDGMNGDVSGFALTLGEFIGCAVLVLVR